MTQHGGVLVHSTYFKLSSPSEAVNHRFIEACKKYLSGHPGQKYFFVGPRDEDITRDVSDLNFDIAMTIIFKSVEDYNDYQLDPKHQQFIKETDVYPNTRRVFDSFAV
jgi:hypothetical protein